MRNWSYVIIITIVLLIIVFGFLGYYFFQPGNRLEKITRSPCLLENEFADYQIDERYAKEIKIPKIPLVISVRDKNTKQEKFSFQIDNASKAVHALEMYKCNIYVIRVFNFDEKRGVPLPDYRTELWRFYYNGSGEKLIDLFKKEGAPDNYGQNFRIDPTETYLVLERSYLGNPNYALVIKSLETKEDVFVLTLDELIRKYFVTPASLGLGKWRDNGRYFWAVLFMGPRINAYIRIERDNWKVDVLPTPNDYTGRILSSPTGEYIAYDNGPGFIGIDIIAQEIYNEWRKEGKKVSLFVYNLFTRDKIMLATTDNPEWDFKTKWISDTELEYYLPPGERKIYKINE